MSRFVFSNNKDIFDSCCSYINNNLFNKYSAFASDKEKIYLRIYKKLNVNNFNYYQEDSNFVASTGTLIYNNKVGMLSLKDILKDYEGDLIKIRDKCYGGFSLFIKKGNEIVICCDENEIYNIFYYYDHITKDFLISNYTYFMAKTLTDRITINEFALLEKYITPVILIIQQYITIYLNWTEIDIFICKTMK